MAKHETRKNTGKGKEETLSQRRQRAMKYHVPPFDTKRIERELHGERKQS